MARSMTMTQNVLFDLRVEHDPDVIDEAVDFGGELEEAVDIIAIFVQEIDRVWLGQILMNDHAESLEFCADQLHEADLSLTYVHKPRIGVNLITQFHGIENAMLMNNEVVFPDVLSSLNQTVSDVDEEESAKHPI